jgi:lipopolysaccharide/colanic/teichoic acid biosynthesis glycosyltransferase
MQDKLIRFFDIFFSGVALMVLSPLLVPIMIILKFTGEGEVFYLQERIGKDGKPFKLIKFATMLKNSANIGSGEITLANDPRVLPFGKFFRKTKINELPQVINILKGDISIIGWRPQTNKYYYLFLNEDRNIIKTIRPGLSGIGSIIFRDEESIFAKVDNPIEFDKHIITPYKGKLEVWYAENRNIKRYFELILITVIVVLFPDKFDVFQYYKDLPKPPKELEKFLLKDKA